MSPWLRWYSLAVLIALALLVGVPETRAQEAPASGAQPAGETLSGVLSVRWVDPLPGSGIEPRVEYSITDERGRTTRLAVDQEVARSADDLLALSGDRVEVRGTGEPGGRIEVREIEPLRRGAAEPRALTGPRPTVTILCRFSNLSQVTPRSSRWFGTLMGSTKPGLDDYWRELSYDKINLSGSRVAPGGDGSGWVNLPRPISYYGDGSEMNADRLLRDCTRAADPLVNFTNYTNINLMFNGDPAFYALGTDSARLSLDGSTRAYGVTWNPRFSYTPGNGTGHTFLAHEMGHSFGLPHSSGPYGETYDSDWDVMSDGGDCSRPDPQYNCLGNHTISAHKARLGWITASQQYQATATTGQQITIERLSRPAPRGRYLMAKIPIDGSSTVYYTLEARRFVGYDDQAPREGIVIHRVDTTDAEGFVPIAQVVDTDRNGDPNDDGSAWVPGETFTDPDNGVEVSVDRATETGYAITISLQGTR